jgi:hypothetical protein
LYAGLWTAQVGNEGNAIAGYPNGKTSSNGLEVDIYGGIKKEFSGITLGAGFTSYQYTNKTKTGADGKFDTAYNELNFSIAYGPITATINPGYHEAVSGKSQKDYVFYSVKGEFGGFYALYGAFNKSEDLTASKGAGYQFDTLKDGSYVQAGYKTTLGGIDLDAFLVNSSKELNHLGAEAGKKDATTFAVSATKAF